MKQVNQINQLICLGEVLTKLWDQSFIAVKVVISTWADAIYGGKLLILVK